MKAAIPAKGKSLDSDIDERFGHCSFFILLDPESMGFQVIENPGVGERDAAGVLAAQMLIDRGVEAVVVRNIGHNALVTLKGAGVRVYLGIPGTVLDTIQKFKRGELSFAEGPTVGFQEGLENGE